jgi:hypothetical protein
VTGIALSLVAWLTPFRGEPEAGVYDVFATVSFFARVFLLPVAGVWALLGVTALVCRRRWIGGASLVIAAAWAAPEAWAAWPRTPAGGGATFTVASLNLQRSLDDATWAGWVLLEADADFVCLQEVTPASGETLARLLAPVYPHSIVLARDDFDGMAIFSKTLFVRTTPPTPAARFGRSTAAC